jgi:hypothetical protein
LGDDDGAPGVDDDGGEVRRAHQMVTGAPSVNVRLGFHAISANIGSYVQEAGPILLKAVVGVVLGLGQQGMQPRICFHPGECWRILTLVGL